MYRQFSLNYLGDMWSLKLWQHGLMTWQLSPSTEIWDNNPRYPTTEVFPPDGMLMIPGVALERGILRNLDPEPPCPDKLARQNFPFLGELMGFPILVVEYMPYADTITAYPDTPDGNRDYMKHLDFNARLAEWQTLFHIRATQERFLYYG